MARDEEIEQREPTAPLDELIEVGNRMKRDKARLIELCRMIAGGEDAVREAVIEASKPARRGGRRKVNKVNAVNKVPVSSPVEKIKKEPWRKVGCSICGEVTGAIRKGDGVGRLYPSRHKDSSTGERCRGVDQPAMVATE